MHDLDLLTLCQEIKFSSITKVEKSIILFLMEVTTKTIYQYGLTI